MKRVKTIVVTQNHYQNLFKKVAKSSLGLFVKYAVDNGLLPPIVRVIGGYLSGVALIYFAYRFWDKYTKYSGVLFSGGVAVMYFTSYIGYAFFEPPVLAMMVAFYLMLSFTIVTIIVANYFKTEMIGLVGLVGAYAVPFLVNSGSENYFVFFTYISIINAVVVYLAVRNKWEMTVRVACCVTAFIYLTTYISGSGWLLESTFSWIFILINFITFQSALAVGILKKEARKAGNDYTFFYINSIALYWLSAILISRQLVADWMGKLTFMHAVLHFGLAYLINRKSNRKDVFWKLSFFAALFFTIAIPIEFKLGTVISLWSLELLGLLYISRKYGEFKFESLMWFLLSVTLVFVICQWSFYYYDPDIWFSPIVNWSLFITGIFLFSLFGVNKLNKIQPSSPIRSSLFSVLNYLIVGGLYLLFFSEVYHLFKPLFWENVNGQPLGNANQIIHFLANALMVYSMVFISIISFIGRKKWYPQQFNEILFYVSLLLTIIFLTVGIGSLNYLRAVYFDQDFSKTWFILARYISYLFFIPFVFVLNKEIQEKDDLEIFKKYEPLILHIALLVLLSHEVITIISLFLGTLDVTLPYREGLSILWGMYSFLLIGLGMKKDLKVLRVGGMFLFGLTLIKIFIYDLAGLNIVSRMVIFIGLGILLLVTSYLYQRKSVIK